MLVQLAKLKYFKMALLKSARCCFLAEKCLNYAITGEIGRRGIKRFVRPTILELVRRQKLAEKLPVEKTKRSSFIEWNINAEIYAFGKRLGEEFKIESLLQAFVHKSYIIQQGMKLEEVGVKNPTLALQDNENLAKLGEALISKEAKRFLAASLPRLPHEGIIAIHNYLLKDKTLGEISKNLGTTDIILSEDYPVEEDTLAKTLKAIVGALIESQSEKRASKFVRDIILTQLADRDVNDFYEISEPLKVLTEILARDGRETPEPRIIGQSAPADILACYTVGIYCSKELIGEGPGETVNTAIEMAARDALNRLFGTTCNKHPLKFDVDIPEDVTNNLRLTSWKSSAFLQ